MKKITTVYSQYVFFGTDQESVERGGGGVSPYKDKA